MDLNPEWDRAFLDVCRSGRVEDFDRYTADEMDAAAGHSSHEVRTWVAAYSALRACGEYDVTYESTDRSRSTLPGSPSPRHNWPARPDPFTTVGASDADIRYLVFEIPSMV